MFKIEKNYEPSLFDRVYEIECACFPHGQRFSKATMKQYLRSHTVLLAWLTGPSLSDTVIVGTLLLKVNKTYSYVSSVSVLKEYRGQGFASALLKQAERECKEDLRKVRLHVRVDNPAQKLYFDLGYRVVKIVPKFYSDGKTALLMEKPL